MLGGWILSSQLFAQTAIIHQWITEVECTGENSATISYKIDFTVNDKRGEDLCNWIQSYEKGIWELKKFSGVIQEGNGKVTKIKKGDLGMTEYSNNLADDSYRCYYAPRTSSYPMHITYQWEETASSTMFYPPFYPVLSFETIVDSAAYRLITTDKNNIRMHKRNIEEKHIVQYDEKGKHITQITMAHLPAIQYYADGLPLNEQVPIVHFAPDHCKYKGSEIDMSDWNAYGKWCYDLQKGRQQLPEELIQKLHSMTDSCTTVKSKVGIIRKFMGETTRYVNIALGIGGYQSRSAEEVYKQGIGDCKALSNYFCSMLHALDIPAIYTLIGEKNLMDDMPNFQQLNHVIVQVPLPGDTLWVECTNAHYPFDYCPSDHRGHEVLLITEHGGILSKIPERKDEENFTHEVFDIYLDSLGNAKLEMNRHCFGEDFERCLSLPDMRNEDLNKYIINTLYLPHPMVENLSVTQNDKEMSINLISHSYGWAKSSGKRLFVPILPHQARMIKQSPKHIVDLRDAGYKSECEISLHLPSGYTIESLPDSQILESDFGKYSVQITPKEDVIYIKQEMQFNSALYAEEKHTEWLNYCKQIATLSKKQITLKAK